MNRTLTLETKDKVGQQIKLQGWVDSKRDHGKITFIDLRDRSGLVQIVGFQKLSELRIESVIEVIGTVKDRSENYVNKQLPTGKVEVEVESYTLLNDCEELPITLDDDGLNIGELPRLKYRYIDLRRPRLQHNLRMRSQLVDALRQALFKQDFVEIETPMLTKSTKEGARDFLVPSRFQPGKFYALPQSPQQYKQLLMSAGFERYFQVARCIRDEDLRADRGFEFTQLDLEMSFVTQPVVMKFVESMVKQAVEAVGGKLKQQDFPVIDYQDAMKKYGADKFDLRSEQEKKDNVLAFAWVINFPFFKKVDRKDLAEVRDSKSGWTFTHNPFSQPKQEFVQDHLDQKNLDKILTTQYDLVCNGYEIGGGSIRAHDPAVLAATFKTMGYSAKQIEESVGHMLRAFKLGTPPHGGIALGIDRLVMLLANEKSLKEVVAFPMTSTGRTAVMAGPNAVEPDQLTELGISIKNQTDSSAHDQK
jgi:aspartyl-tRNA synthetase